MKTMLLYQLGEVFIQILRKKKSYYIECEFTTSYDMWRILTRQFPESRFPESPALR
jgi:hypothetical protein